MVQALRLLRWVLWIAFLGFTFYVLRHPQDYLNSFGQLSPRTELILFALPMAAVAMGLAEMAAKGSRP